MSYFASLRSLRDPDVTHRISITSVQIPAIGVPGQEIPRELVGIPPTSTLANSREVTVLTLRDRTNGHPETLEAFGIIPQFIK
jgi:hypothetical protein